MVGVGQLLCDSGIDVNYSAGNGWNALAMLSQNKPFTRPSISKTVRLLIDRGIDVNFVANYGQSNALVLFAENFSDIRKCIYDQLSDLNESNFWEMLVLLVDAGVDVNPSCYDKNSVLWRILRQFGNYCDKCSYCVLNAQNARTRKLVDSDRFTGVLAILDRLFKAGASPNVNMEYRTLGRIFRLSQSLLFIVCSKFRGDELISLVKLLCENGVDVNETTALGHTSNNTTSKRYSKHLNAIQVLRAENPSQIHKITELVGIMAAYGFRGSSE